MDRGAWWATVQGVSKRTRHDVVTNTFTVIAVWGSIVLNLFTYSSAIFKFYAWVEGEKGVTDVQQSAAGGVLAGAGDLVFPAHCCALRGFGSLLLEKSQLCVCWFLTFYFLVFHFLTLYQKIETSYSVFLTDKSLARNIAISQCPWFNLHFHN